jgi:hypothetical protein
MYSVVFTSSGYNMYALMLQQLYNWKVDWDFMCVWCPFHVIGGAYIRSAMVEARMRIQSREWPSADNAFCLPSMTLCDMCDRPMAPCECVERFPCAGEVWTRPHISIATAEGSEGYSSCWCRKTKAFPQTYCFARQMRLQYRQHMPVQSLVLRRVDTSRPLATRKCAKGRLFRWLRGLWLLTAQQALLARLGHNEDLVHKILRCC